MALFHQINYYHTTAARQSHYCFSPCSTLFCSVLTDAEEQKKVRVVMFSEKFEAWVRSDSNTCVTIDSGITHAAMEPSTVRGVSCVASRLIWELDPSLEKEQWGKNMKLEKRNVVTLHVFCQKHKVFELTEDGSSNVFRTLFGQLIRQRPEVIKITAVLLSSPPGDRDRWRWAFELCLRFLPREVTVFCVVDCFDSYLNDNQTHAKAELLVKFLVDQVIQKSGVHGPEAVFKLLLTMASDKKPEMKGDRRIRYLDASEKTDKTKPHEKKSLEQVYQQMELLVKDWKRRG
jgi:hypothetical protein